MNTITIETSTIDTLDCSSDVQLPLVCSLIFGAITCVTGLLGVVIGAVTTRMCRQKTERADPLVCAVSMLGSAIFICLIFVTAKKSIEGAYVSYTTFFFLCFFLFYFVYSGFAVSSSTPVAMGAKAAIK